MINKYADHLPLYRIKGAELVAFMEDCFRLADAPDLEKRFFQRYCLLGLAVGDGVAAGGGVTLKVPIFIFHVSPSRTLIDDQYPFSSTELAPLT